MPDPVPYAPVSRPVLLGLTAAAALVALSPASPARAAQADRALDRRVAGLEAELRLLKNRVKALENRAPAGPDQLVVSGNSRVKVTLYGQVNRAVRFAFGRRDMEVHHVDNDGSSSRIGILGEARLSPDLTLSALTEVEWQENRRLFTNDANDGNFRARARHVDLIVTHATLGTLHIGHGDVATYDTTAQSFSGTAIVFTPGGCSDDAIRFTPPSGNSFPPFGLTGGAACGNLEALRDNRVMYVSPQIEGFSLRASHGEQDAVEASLFYRGTPLGTKEIDVAGAFGLGSFPGPGASTPTLGGRGTMTSYTGSIAARHTPSGLNLAFAAGTANLWRAARNPVFWYVEAGWRGTPWTAGRTGVSVHYGRYDHMTAGAHAWVAGIALRQEVDAAAADLYVGYRLADAKLNGPLDAVHILLVGARVKF